MRRDDHYPFYFGRNTGIYSADDVEKIRKARIGIAGLGGSGGYSLLFLVHMGFEHFKIADHDSYEEHNKNRQIGAFARNIGRPKTESLLELAKGLNPYAEIEVYEKGITQGNARAFVEGTDFVIETMDFNVPGAKFALHDAAVDARVHISTSPSPAYGAPVYNFGPKTPTFAQAFGLDPIDTFKDPKHAKRFIERLALPNLADYPAGHKERILSHCYKAAVGETHLTTNIMGVSTSAQLLCMAALETTLYGEPRVQVPKILMLDHMTFQYRTIDLESFDWKN
jgi:molybdopterin/thiamine biosynthesis adenylyltransferase